MKIVLITLVCISFPWTYHYGFPNLIFLLVELELKSLHPASLSNFVWLLPCLFWTLWIEITAPLYPPKTLSQPCFHFLIFLQCHICEQARKSWSESHFILSFSTFPVYYTMTLTWKDFLKNNKKKCQTKEVLGGMTCFWLQYWFLVEYYLPYFTIAFLSGCIAQIIIVF